MGEKKVKKEQKENSKLFKQINWNILEHVEKLYHEILIFALIQIEFF